MSNSEGDGRRRDDAGGQDKKGDLGDCCAACSQTKQEGNGRIDLW